MTFYVLAMLAAAALVWAHVTADECTIYGEDAEQYTVDITPMGCLLAGVVAARVRQGIMPAFFVRGLLCLVCVMSGVFGAMWFAVGQYPAAVAGVGVLAVAGYSIHHIIPYSTKSLRAAFD